MKLKISKKYILNIREFMSNFLNISYTAKNKLTHKEMKRFLYEKNKIIPRVIRFNEIKKEDILRGNCILVKDVTNKIIAYDNPKKLEKIILEVLMKQQNKTNSTQQEYFDLSKSKIRQKRK